MPREKLQLPNRETLNSLFAYDPVKGELIYKKKRRGRGSIKPGDRAGVKQPNGYYTVMVNKHRYYVHRLVWFMHHGTNPELVDHVDGDRDNNRIENLTSTTMNEYKRGRLEIRDAQMERDALEYVS